MINMDALKERAREGGTLMFSLYPPERLRYIRSNLMGYMPHEAHYVGAWSWFRPSGASDGEYPKVGHLSYEQLVELDEAWLAGANDVLNPYGLKAAVYGKRGDGTLVITRYRKV